MNKHPSGIRKELYDNIGDLSLDQCYIATLQWSKERGITVNGKSVVQALKLGSEFGEMCDNLAKGKCVKDDIGDQMVVLSNIAQLEGLTLEECWNQALNDIKDRKGFLTEDGIFVKDTDAGYKELMEKQK